MMLASIIHASIASAGGACSNMNIGAGIPIPKWASQTNDEVLKLAEPSCLYYEKETRSMEKYSKLQWKVMNKPLYHKDYYSDTIGKGYVRNLSYFLDKESGTERLSNGYYNPQNEAFKRVYEQQMDECIDRCSLLEDNSCVYADAVARVYRNELNSGALPEELVEFSSNMDDAYLKSKDKQIYFHCSFGSFERGRGITARKNPGKGDGPQYAELFQIADDPDWCTDGDTYASHVVMYHGNKFHHKQSYVGNKLMAGQGSIERDHFCSHMGEMCIVVNEIEHKSVKMSSPVSYTLKETDYKRNIIVEHLKESNDGVAYFDSIDEMNQSCIENKKCAGYNFWANDNLARGGYYSMQVYELNVEDSVEDVVTYYRENKGWHKERALDRIFSKMYPNDGSSGMVLKLIECAAYEEIDVLEKTCEDGAFKVIGKDSAIPLGYRLANTQEAVNNMHAIADDLYYPDRPYKYLKETEPHQWTKLSDGYLTTTETSNLNAFFDLGNKCNTTNKCNYQLLICSHGEEKGLRQNRFIFKPSNSFKIQTKSADVQTDNMRFATREEVLENKQLFIDEMNRRNITRVGIQNGYFENMGESQNLIYQYKTGFEQQPDDLLLVEVESNPARSYDYA